MVADALRSEYVSAVTPDARIAIMNVAAELAHRFAVDNPRFDSARFYDAVEGA